MKMKIGLVKDENEKPGKKMKMNWLCLGGDPKKVANECDENIFARFLKSHKYSELRSLPEKKRVEYPGYSTSSHHHYQNLPSNPFTVPCYPGRVPCNVSPKCASKTGHRVAAVNVADCTTSGDVDAFDQPPPHSKQRLHHPQRVRKHSTSSSTAVINAANLSQKNLNSLPPAAQAVENQPKMEPSSCSSAAQSLPVAAASVCASQTDAECATSITGAVPHLSDCCADACASQQSADLSSGNVVASCRVASLASSTPFTSGAPFSFHILPPASVYQLGRADQRLSESFYTSEDDMRIISESQQHLRLSGWYHERLSWLQASELLMHAPVGTFLLRDSADMNYLYSLSVQTKCGPTSIRIHYANGQFRLCSSAEEAKQLPKFPCIVQLLQHYAEHTQKLPLPCISDENQQNWSNVVGGPPTTTPIVLRKPMYVDRGQVPSLKHLSRLCVNRNLKDPSFASVLHAPANVTEYLKEYPFKL